MISLQPSLTAHETEAVTGRTRFADYGDRPFEADLTDVLDNTLEYLAIAYPRIVLALPRRAEGVSMRVSMVAVRRVRMSMPDRRVHVPMAMRLAPVDGTFVGMVVMLVVIMAVFVGKFGVLVNMIVVFAEMQPDPEGHQGAGRDQLKGDSLAE